MTQLEEFRAQLAVLRDREREYREQLAHTGADRERDMLRHKVSMYRAMIKELREQIDHLDPPAQRRARTAKVRTAAGKATFSLFEGAGVEWADISGHSWDQVEQLDFLETAEPEARVQAWLAEGAALLTAQQAEDIDAYYNAGLSLAAIAAARGVSRSAVSRNIQRGLARMRSWVESKQLIDKCGAGDGRFDWERFLRRLPAITARQREMLLLVLSRPPNGRKSLGAGLELDQSTVTRTICRAGRTLRRLDPPRASPTSRPSIRWEGAGPRSLAIQTGMGLGFYYKHCKDRPDGMTRYNYELLRRLRAGQSAEDTAAELGMEVKTIRAAYGRVRRMYACP